MWCVRSPKEMKMPELDRQESKIIDRIMAAGHRQDDKSDFNHKSPDSVIPLKRI